MQRKDSCYAQNYPLLQLSTNMNQKAFVKFKVALVAIMQEQVRAIIDAWLTSCVVPRARGALSGCTSY